MTLQYSVRRKYTEIASFLDAVRTHADSERNALGFLPGPAYLDAAQQGKLFVLVATDEGSAHYAGHLLFGGIFPHLRVRQICISPKYRGHGNATKLLRALKSQGESEGYLSIVANVATDLQAANLFYENNGFATRRLKLGGSSRGRTINVKTLQLETPNLLSKLDAQNSSLTNLIQPKKRSTEAPLYAIDLNVFFDLIRNRPRAKDAGSVFNAALSHQIRLAASDEFLKELVRNSSNQRQDPVLALARQIPSLPTQNMGAVEALIPAVTALVFSARSKALTDQDKSDVLHLCHAISAGAAGYITSDVTVLSARDNMMSRFGLDIIALSEFVELLELPIASEGNPLKATKNFRIDRSNIEEINEFLDSENILATEFLGVSIEKCERLCVSDSTGIIGVSALLANPAINQSSRSIVCVRQDHPFSSTVVDFLIAEQLRVCSGNTGCSMELLDTPGHPITRRIAFSHGFQTNKDNSHSLTKIALGRPITKGSWDAARLVIERLSGLKVQDSCPSYDRPIVRVTPTDGRAFSIPLFELESLLSPTLLVLPHRISVIVPIARQFADALLGTALQLSLLEVPEAQFLSRRTYFNTTRAANAMIRGSVIAFYESGKRKGRGGIVAVARIVDVTSVPKENVPEFLQRGAVVEDVGELTKGERILVTTFDNLLHLKEPVMLQTLRKIGCVTPSNLVSATPITSAQLEEIVRAGFPDE